MRKKTKQTLVKMLTEGKVDQFNKYRQDLYKEGEYNADLCNANLCNANLYNANLYNADLYNANLYNANLRNANLCNADLRNADLRNANLRNADLCNAKNLTGIKFQISNLLHNINWGNLSDKLTLELMKRDAIICGEEKMTAWAINGGECPFGDNIVRDFWFVENKELWKPGNPKMNDMQLFKALCKEKGMKIL